MIRDSRIDVIKGLAIISVIFLHSIPPNILLKTLSPIHIWQAVPVFMLLSGYNSSKSLIRKEIGNISHLYSIRYLLPKIKQIIIPFLYIYFIQLIILVVYKNTHFTAYSLFKSFVYGGWGPGSYFISLMVQTILIFPLLFYFFLKNKFLMLLTTFLISIGLEYFSLIFIPDTEYRILFFRYLFAIVLGIWLAYQKSIKIKTLLVFLSTLSLAYIIGVNYFNLKLIIEPLWRDQHLFSYFYTLILVILGIKYIPNKENIISKLGQTSYYIFLTQMFYFWALSTFSIHLSSNVPLVYYIMINVIVCCTIGIFFNKVEKKIRI